MTAPDPTLLGSGYYADWDAADDDHEASVDREMREVAL